MLRHFVALLCLLALAACSSSAPRGTDAPGAAQSDGRGDKPPADAPARSGAYYKDDGPGANPPDFDKIADAQPKAEPLHRFANNPYQVFGKDYVPVRVVGSFRQRGIASWYGRRYHGQKTSSGEIYDMYAMTAAHPTLPIPSYARVTSVANGRAVVVRINDRGPFHSDRVMDLSFVAAYKLGYTQSGSTLVEIQSLPSDGSTVAEARPVSAKPAPTATSRPATVEAPPALPVMREAGGVYLQLGTFSIRDNAESFRAKIYKDLAWLNDAMQVSAQGNLFRLRLGPYRSEEDARRVAERIQSDLNLKPVLLVR